MGTSLEQHLRAELTSGSCSLELEELEGLAHWAYQAAGLEHALDGELPEPARVAQGLGLTVRLGRPPSGLPFVRVGDLVVHRPLSPPQLGLGIVHESAHKVLGETHQARHTHADVVALTLCIALPLRTARVAVLAGEASTEGLTLWQPWVPRWVLTTRLRMLVVGWAGATEAA